MERVCAAADMFALGMLIPNPNLNPNPDPDSKPNPNPNQVHEMMRRFNAERRLRRAFWVVVACNRFVYFARASAERKLAAVVERMEESTHLSAG